MSNHRATKSVALTRFTFQSHPDSDIDSYLVPTETVIPTNVHLDLIKSGLISDPHTGVNERDVQWVHDRDWSYKTHFEVEEGWRDDVFAGRAIMELVCEGLDTFGVIRINSQEIKRTNNMFLAYEIPLQPAVLNSDMKAKNESEIVFENPMRVGSKTMEANGGESVTWNGHYCRNFLRKEQYHFVGTTVPKLEQD